MRFGLALLLLLSLPSWAAEPPAADPENTVFLELEYGRVVIRMRPDLAPKHVERVKHLIRGGYYDGMVFHRVIDKFAAQTGDVKGDGTGAGTGRMLSAEFTRTPQVRGTVSMARGAKRNSADAEWFIVLDDNGDTRSSLDGKYTVWGEVVTGMEFVDRIPKGDKTNDGRGIAEPAHIIKMQIAADAEAPQLATPALLARPDAGATAKNFSASEFKCAGLVNGRGATTQYGIAQLWTHGYLAGRFQAAGGLSLAAESAGDDPALAESCAKFPMAFLITIAAQELSKTPRPLPAATPVFHVETYTCRSFADSRKASRKDEAELVGLWVFAFIQGYKNVSQPEMEIPWDARPRLLDAMAAACAKFPDRTLLNLAGAVAAKVRIK